MTSNSLTTKYLLEVLPVLQDQHIRDDFRPAVIVIVGSQSAGKTTFIETIIGYPIGLTNSTGIGTRNPVRYVLRHSSHTTLFATINNVEVPIHELRDKIRDHMLAQGENVNSQELVVHISGPGVVNMDIIDLPGLPAKVHKHYNAVVNLIQDYASREEVSFVMIAKFPDPDPQAQRDVDAFDEVLYPIRPNWKHDIIFIKNSVNIALKAMNSVDEVNSYFHDHRDPRVFYTLLRPVQFDPNSISIDKYAKRLMSIRETEELQAYDNLIHNIEKKDKLNRKIPWEFRERVGIKRIAEAINEQLSREIMRQLPSIKKSLRSITQNTQKLMDENNQAMDSLNPNTLRHLYSVFTSDFMKFTQATWDTKRIIEHLDDDDGQQLIWEPNAFGLSMDEELKFAHGSGSHHILMGIEEAKQILSDRTKSRQVPTGLLQRLDFLLVGNAQIDRFTRYYGFLLFQLKQYQSSIDEIVSEATRSGVLDGVDANKLLSNIHQKSIHEVKRTIPWVTQHLKYLITRHFDSIFSHLVRLPRHRAIKDHTGFRTHLEALYLEFVDETVGSIKTHIDQMVSNFENVLLISAYASYTSMLGVIPFTGQETEGISTNDNIKLFMNTINSIITSVQTISLENQGLSAIDVIDSTVESPRGLLLNDLSPKKLSEVSNVYYHFSVYFIWMNIRLAIHSTILSLQNNGYSGLRERVNLDLLSRSDDDLLLWTVAGGSRPRLLAESDKLRKKMDVLVDLKGKLDLMPSLGEGSGSTNNLNGHNSRFPSSLHFNSPSGPNIFGSGSVGPGGGGGGNVGSSTPNANTAPNAGGSGSVGAGGGGGGNEGSSTPNANTDPNAGGSGSVGAGGGGGGNEGSSTPNANTDPNAGVAAPLDDACKI